MKIPHLVLTASALLLAFKITPLSQADDHREGPRSEEAKPKRGDGPKEKSEGERGGKGKSDREASDERAKAKGSGPKPAPGQASEKEQRTYLGLRLVPVPTPIREYLDLESGFGVMVDSVVEGSPAEKAKVAPRDIVTKFGDQLITTPDHLSLLVRREEPGTKRTLEVVRKGSTKEIEITLGQIEVPRIVVRREAGAMPAVPRFDRQNPERFREDIRRYQDDIREMMERRGEWRRDVEKHHDHGHDHDHPHPHAHEGDAEAEKKECCGECEGGSCETCEDCPGCEEGKCHCESGTSDCPDCEGCEVDKTKEAEDETAEADTPKAADAGGRPPAVMVQPGFPVNIFGAEGILKIDNEAGELTITHNEGEHFIEMRDISGELIHEGPYDPDQGVESLPAAAQEHLQKMKLDSLDILTPVAEDASPEPASTELPETSDKTQPL
ncbi:MAG: PDZ domain-containing protein [Verrucomicrobiota bacterium]